jgi:hypothetical protein
VRASRTAVAAEAPLGRESGAPPEGAARERRAQDLLRQKPAARGTETRCGPDREAAQDAWRRWLTAAWAFAVALNGTALVPVVASRDPALIALAGGLVGNLIVVLTETWKALRSLLGREPWSPRSC